MRNRHHVLGWGAVTTVMCMLLLSVAGTVDARTIVADKNATPNCELVLVTIREALAMASAGDTVLVRSGVYEEYGLKVPDGVALIGTGFVHIKGELPVTASTDQANETSTIDMFGNGRLENLTVTARNMRYPVHSDFSAGNTRQDVVNCIFIHYGSREIYEYRKERGMPSPEGADDIFRVQSAWGGGTMAGDRRFFYGCRFESPLRGFSTHNNVGFDSSYGPSLTVLQNCEMVSHGRDLDGSPLGFAAPVVIQGLESNSPDAVIMSGCIINGYLCFQGEPTHRVRCDTPHLKVIFNTAGSGRTVLDQSDILYRNPDWYVTTPGETQLKANTGEEAIERGCAVKHSMAGVGPMDVDDDPALFAGVALERIAPGTSGMVKVAGYLHRAYFAGLCEPELKAGDRISISTEGTFAITHERGIGTVSDNGNIYLITCQPYQ